MKDCVCVLLMKSAVFLRMTIHNWLLLFVSHGGYHRRGKVSITQLAGVEAGQGIWCGYPVLYWDDQPMVCSFPLLNT